MTDRELLELAAKAAELCEPDFSNMQWDKPWIMGFGYWNPLTDDGDALRLAVKTGEPFVVRTSCVTTMSGLREDFNPDTEADDLRATRRVIVRAAAEIGRKK